MVVFGLIVSAGIAVQASAVTTTPKPVAVKVTMTKATVASAAYSGSQCQSNTYSGQCSSGSCTCYVAGSAPVVVTVKKSSHDTANVFLTVDNGLTTGTPSCSPAFGVFDGSGGALTIFFYGTYCATSKTGSFSLDGGWSIDLSSEAASGFGKGSGTLDTTTNELTLDLTGTGVPK